MILLTIFIISTTFNLLNSSAIQITMAKTQSQSLYQLFKSKSPSQIKNLSTNIDPKLNTINGRTLFNLQSIFLNSLFNKVQGSIVEITASSGSNLTFPSAIPPSPNPPSEEQNKSSLGSGFVYDTKGHVVTNSHVVGNAKNVDVTFTDGNKYIASVLGKDPIGDLAVLKIIDNNTKPLVPLNISSSSTLKVGDTVIAIGNPYGLDNTMTTGIVSQIGHVIQESPNTLIIDAIQTDATINPGNSGGPLLNTNGQVIGVNTASDSIGVYFAISSNTILKEIPILIDKGNFTHSYLGINGMTFTSNLASQFKDISKSIRGVYVNTIAKGSPADLAGIQGSTTDYYGQKHGGDIITAVNNQNLTKIDQLVKYVDQNTRPGDSIMLTVSRDGHYENLNSTVSARPSSTPFHK